jgi:hypothetical protein
MHVPLISSSVKGPLGVVHLPRLWLKLLLKDHETLAEGWGYGHRGFDLRLSEMLGIDREAMIGFVASAKPDYLTFEKWVAANATNLSPETIAAFNASVLGQAMPDPRKAEWQARFAIDPAYDGAVALNDLDDWACFHDRFTARET